MVRANFRRSDLSLSVISKSDNSNLKSFGRSTYNIQTLKISMRQQTFNGRDIDYSIDYAAWYCLKKLKQLKLRASLQY